MSDDTLTYYAVKDLGTGLFLGHNARWGSRPRLWSDPRYALNSQKGISRWCPEAVVVIMEVNEA